jgi:hypothetical protein
MSAPSTIADTTPLSQRDGMQTHARPSTNYLCSPTQSQANKNTTRQNNNTTRAWALGERHERTTPSWPLADNNNIACMASRRERRANNTCIASRDNNITCMASRIPLVALGPTGEGTKLSQTEEEVRGAGRGSPAGKEPNHRHRQTEERQEEGKEGKEHLEGQKGIHQTTAM